MIQNRNTLAWHNEKGVIATHTLSTFTKMSKRKEIPIGSIIERTHVIKTSRPNEDPFSD